MQDGFVLTAAGVIVSGPKRPVELVELVDDHGGGAAVYRPAVGVDSAVMIIGEGIQVSLGILPLPKVARQDAGHNTRLGRPYHSKLEPGPGRSRPKDGAAYPKPD